MRFIVDKEIFQLFPGLRIVTVAVNDLGTRVDEATVKKMLKIGWENAGKAAYAYGNPQSHPMIFPWVEAMKAVGVSRKKFPSSIESMVRRAGKGGEPFSISPVVDFYNGVSLMNIVPAGGFDLDQLESDLRLRLSVDGDTFLPLDGDEEVLVPPGEVSYAQGSHVITRHFVWKQARRALLTEASRNILFVSEILGQFPQETVTSVGQALVQGLGDCFSFEAEYRILHQGDPVLEL